MNATMMTRWNNRNRNLPPWQPAPAHLALEPGWVHVFHFDLDLPEAEITQLAALLAPDEQARAARYRFERDRRRFSVARGQLRQVLAAYLGLAPTAVQFASNEYGKPYLPGARSLQFNLSHSGECGLLAVCDGLAVGVDVETIRAEVERENIARRFFAPAEVEALLALPPEQHSAGFFACWTRKEAYIKARGQGLSIDLGAFVVSLAPGAPAQLLARDPGAPEGPFTMANIDPGPGQAAALVVIGEIDGVRLYSW